MVTKLRLRLFVAGLAATGLLFSMGRPDGTPRTVQAAEGVDPADDAATWKAFMTGKLLEEVLAGETDVLATTGRSKATFARGAGKSEVCGHMVAMLGNVGTLILEGEEAQKAAALRDAGVALAEAAKKKDFDAAKAAIEIIESYPKTIKPAESGTPIKFGELLSLDNVMKGVSRADSATGAGVRKVGAAFSKEAKPLAAQSYLMACLAVSSRVHNEAEDWKKWCDDMKDGSVKMAEQFTRKSADGAKEARANLQKSCAECHDAYREET